MATSTLSSSGLRILLVDDDPDGLALLSELLRQAGHDVAEASVAEEALQKMDSFRPHVAVIDIGLPDLDGYELARRMREQGHCRLFALSGYSADTAPREEAVSSFDKHFVKPVVVGSLLDAIREAAPRA